ncbi:MAG: NAD(P)-dependent alcohol dehydrogenase [Acidisphaera sp.]|nr:NAD(P)-dependent alcohol dehydrogenase [Acidisphaera sp.]
MKAYKLPQAAGIGSLTLLEVPTPQPGRGQALVRMRACSLNYRDLMVAGGRYARGSVPAGLVPLSDGAGEVAAVGAGVSRVRVGDRVAGIFMQSWLGGQIGPEDHRSALGGAIDGVLAEYVVFDQEGLVHLPDAYAFEEGATLPCAALTAWHALFHQGALLPGHSVLVLGTGGVSIFALQFAHAAGARVIATSSSPEKLDHALALGATDGIDYHATPDWQDAVLRLTGGRGVDHVIEVGGAGTLARSLQAVRLGGTVHMIGVLTGQAEIDPMPIMRRSLTVRGVYVGSREMFLAMNRAIAFHDLHPVIDKVFPFAEAPAAYRHLERQAHVGKVVIRVD